MDLIERQVPNDISPTYTLVGSGRLARHLACYFDFLNIRFNSWSRRQTSELKEAVQSASHVLLAISDRAIEPFLNDHLDVLSDKTVIHFSGALSTPLAESAHPLMTFSHDLYDREKYTLIPFVLEEGRKKFDELFPGLPNPHFYIPSEQKSLYHSYCVMSGNFTNILWSEILKRSEEQLGLPTEVFLPFLKQTLENLINDPKNSLTGPLDRRDLNTIQSHLKILENSPFEAVYQSFLKLKDINL